MIKSVTQSFRYGKNIYTHKIFLSTQISTDESYNVDFDIAELMKLNMQWKFSWTRPVVLQDSLFISSIDKF